VELLAEVTRLGWEEGRERKKAKAKEVLTEPQVKEFFPIREDQAMTLIFI
jgi:hypothetical protein